MSPLWTILREILQIYGERLLQDGERYLKTQSLIFSLKTLKAVRLFTLALTLYLIFAVLCAISFFITALLLLQSYTETGTWNLTPSIYFTGAFVIFSAIVIAYFSRQSFWIKAFSLDKKIMELAGLTASITPPASILNSLKKNDNQELETKILMMERHMEQRIQQAIDQALSQRAPASTLNH